MDAQLLLDGNLKRPQFSSQHFVSTFMSLAALAASHTHSDSMQCQGRSLPKKKKKVTSSQNFELKDTDDP
jgi:hypothetical protein